MRAKGRHRHEEDKVEAGQQGSEKASQGQMRCNNWGGSSMGIQSTREDSMGWVVSGGQQTVGTVKR